MTRVGSSRSGASARVRGAGPPPSPSVDPLRRAWPAYVVLACTLLLTLGAWRYAEQSVRADEQERFDRIVATSREAIDRRLDSYVQILLGVRALFAASAAVDRAEFRAYVAVLDLEGRYPGIQGIGWSPRVPAAARAQHEAAMRGGGLPRYEIHPASDRREYHPVVFAEPAEGFEPGIFGLDVGSRPENRVAMDRARDSGQPAMSDRSALRRPGEGGPHGAGPRSRAARLESAMDAFVGMDHEGRITEFNPAAERMFGHPRDEVLGQELASVIIPPSFRDAHRRGLAHHLATGRTLIIGGRIEVTALRKDGSEFPVELTVTRAGAEDRPAFNAYIRDLTAQKLADAARASLEMQLQQAQKMEAIGRLAGGVAHDFNNLLTVISGRAHILLSRLKPGEAMHRDVELIEKTSQRAVALTSQLLAFSRKQVVQPRVLELGPLMAELAPMLQRMIGEDMEFSILPVEGSGRVMVDPSHMQQVLMNLAVNARDAMPSGGRVTIAVRDVEVADAAAPGQPNLPPGPYVTLTVSDDGAGMSAETAAHIFEPFFTTKEQGKGTGLGLSTVYGIVEQSRGPIEVQSELGRGTTFVIYLPRVEEPVAAAEPPPHAGRRRRTTARTVLVVDDEPEVLELATEILRRVGYRVVEAADGAAAIEAAARHEGEIHLLVTDMVMPGMSGRDLAERLRARRTTLPVLYISGYVQDAAARAALASQHSAFVAKPFTPELLTDRVRELLATVDAETG